MRKSSWKLLRSGNRIGHGLPCSVSQPALMCILLAIIILWVQPAQSEALVADLTSHLIAISTGFTGASVVLFGATDGPGDIAVIVRGPDRDVTVRRKSRIAGIWVNTQQLTFSNVPSFYSVAANRPLDEIVAPTTAAFYHLGTSNIELTVATPYPPEVVAEFRAALLRTQRRSRLFPNSVGKVNFIGDRLFRTSIEFPSNVPTGTYFVEVLLIRDKDVISGQTTPLVVSKVGIDADVFGFAGRQPALYGAIAVATAIVAGWLANLSLRSA
jgi:uncharacterized protein (TIGR02186 family)